MAESRKTLEIRVERTIAAPLDEVFDAWLNPKIPGNPWNAADKLIFNPKVVTFEKQGEDTLMTLVHSGVPDTDGGRSHDNGWNYFFDIFPQQFLDASVKKT